MFEKVFIMFQIPESRQMSTLNCQIDIRCQTFDLAPCESRNRLISVKISDGKHMLPMEGKGLKIVNLEFAACYF